jgi:hypothetical protein
MTTMSRTGHTHPVPGIIARIKKLGTVFYGFYVYNALLPDSSEDEDVEAGKELYSERARQSLEAGRDAFVGDFQRYIEFVRRVVRPDTEVVFLFTSRELHGSARGCEPLESYR